MLVEMHSSALQVGIRSEIATVILDVTATLTALQPTRIEVRFSE
jgi:hypothetical protein